MNEDTGTLALLGAAMLRSGGGVDLYVQVADGCFTAAMHIGDGNDAEQVALARAATLEQALDGLRHSLAAAVREAVAAA